MRLLSWNVQWCRGVDGVVSPARIAAQARRIADPDVACFQEVAAGFDDLPGSRGEDQAQALAREFAGYESAYGWGVDVAGPGRRKRFGNLVLSRAAIALVLRHSLPWPASPDVPSMPRAAVEAVVDAPFGKLRVMTTHLEYYSATHRAAQVERLRDLHSEARGKRQDSDEPGPFRFLQRPASAILCGDFNLAPGDPLHKRLTEPFIDGSLAFVDAWQALHPGAPHPPTFRVHEREESESPYCCDYIFVTEDLVPRLRSIRIDADNRASDHQPVILELT